MKKVKFGELFDFLPKSKIKAGDGLTSGKYPLFTSSQQLTKYVDNYIYDSESLIFGTGGQASIHYYNGKFSTSTDCFVVSAKEDSLDLKYVYLYLKSHIKILEEGFKGAGLKHISKKYISNIKIPLPDTLEEQRKIANLLTQVEELIEKRNESIGLLNELLKSTFFDMFIMNIELKSLDSLGKYIQYMTSGARGWAKYYSDKGALFLRINNVKDAKLILDDTVRVEPPANAEGRRTEVKEDDLLFSITADLGRTAVIPKGFEKAYINQHLALLRLDIEQLNPLYVAYFYISPYGQHLLKKFNKGGVKAGLNFNDIKKMKIYVPEKSIQDKFAKIVQQVEITKQYYQESLDELKELFGSLSQKAFKGELDLSKMPLVKVPEVSGGTEKEEPLHIERQNIEHIRGRAKSGAGEFYDEEVEIPDYMRKPVEDALHMVKKSIDTESFRSMIAQHEKQMKTLALGETMRQMEETANLFKTLHIPNFKIDIPPLFSKVSSFSSLNLDSMGIFKTAKQLMESMQKRKEHILQMLEDIPQINKAIEEGVLYKDDFMSVTLKFDYEYAEIKRIVMDKLSSGEIVQRFDEEKKTMKLVKVR